MTPGLAFVVGALVTLLLMSAGTHYILKTVLQSTELIQQLGVHFIARTLPDDSEGARRLIGTLVGELAEYSGYASLLVLCNGTPQVVAFTEVIRAIEKGDLLTYTAVSLDRDDAKPDGNCDGNA